MNDRYPNFDLLRLLLAVEVVVAHGWYLSNEKFAWAGFITAVPAFLAISGFLVLKSYEESGTWAIFIRKRALRLLPALLVSMALCWALFNGFGVYNSIINWVSGGIYYLKGFANVPLWSLAWEELAYLCLAMLWTAGAYRRPVVIWVLLALSLVIAHQGRDLDAHTQIILSLMPSFFIGNLAYLHRDLLLKVHPIIPWALLLAVIFSTGMHHFHRVISLSPLSFQAFSVVWVGMAGLRLVPFRFPDISYGLYIYHWPIAVYLRDHKLAITTTEMALWLTISLLTLCLLSWYLVEKPALSMKRSPHVHPAI